GPVEWGHPQQPPGRFVNRQTVNVPGADQRLQLETFDTSNGLQRVDRWERTSLDQNAYRFTLDQDAAVLHPTGEKLGLDVDLAAPMRPTPLLAGGTGRFFYNVPEDSGYPSKGYQYQQVAQALTGSLRVRRANGTVVDERVDPARSTLSMVHESDPPE